MASNLVFTRPEASDRAARAIILIVVFGVAALMLLVAGSSGLLLPVAALAGAMLLIWAAWCYPIWGVVALVVMVPLNRFALLLLYNVVGSSLALRGYQLWDDALIATLTLRMMHEAFSRRSAPRLRYLDLLVLLFIAIAAIYIFYPGTLEGSSMFNRFSAFRFDSLFLFAYFIGRGIQLRPVHVRLMLGALVPAAAVVGGVAIWQWVAPGQSNALFGKLSFGDFTASLGGHDDLAVLSRDLSGAKVPRASSLLMGYLALAFYQLCIVSFAAAFLVTATKPLHRALAGAFLAAAIGVLVLTVTRSAVMAAAVSLAAVTITARAYLHMLVVALGLACALLVVVIASGLSGGALREMISTSEPSVQGHASAAQASVRIIEEEPWGRGLGSAGPISQRTRVEGAITNESWYLQIATEIGVIGAALFALIVVLATASAFASYRKLTEPSLRALTLGAAGTATGFMIVGAVLHVWEVSLLSMLVWLFLGIAVRAPELEAQWADESVRLA